MSCKEVSSYLLSLTSPEDLAQQTAVECPGDVAVVNKLVSENVSLLIYFPTCISVYSFVSEFLYFATGYRYRNQN